jgi:RNA polymerase sigma-70 factor, ECF subfamily
MADRDFDEFYAANYGRFVVQLYAVTGSLPDAEDAVQEAFARASVHWAGSAATSCRRRGSAGWRSTWRSPGCAGRGGAWRR